MTQAAAYRSGKSDRTENFPVASHLLAARDRPVIMAFYRFVRTADDVADHPALSADEKLALLDDMEASLLGRTDSQPEGVALRKALAERDLDPVHARHLLKAFRQDATKHRYESWDELMDYCRFSAMPVGRFVLDVCGESRETWPASDALCAALQIINHMQDCGDDFSELDRVYLPLDMLASRGASVEMLAARACAPQLRACLDDICGRVEALLAESARLSKTVRGARIALEVAAIQTPGRAADAHAARPGSAGRPRQPVEIALARRRGRRRRTCLAGAPQSVAKGAAGR